MACKGYYTGSSYFGLVDKARNQYMAFPSDAEYIQYMKERDPDECPDDGPGEHQ